MTAEMPRQIPIEPPSSKLRHSYIMNCETILTEPNFRREEFNDFVDIMTTILGIPEIPDVDGASIDETTSSSFPFSDLGTGLGTVLEGDIYFGRNSEKRSIHVDYRTPYYQLQTSRFQMREKVTLVDEEAHPSNFAFVESSLIPINQEFRSITQAGLVVFDTPIEALDTLDEEHTRSFARKILEFYKPFASASDAVRPLQAQ